MNPRPQGARTGHWRIGPRMLTARPRLLLAAAGGLTVGAAAAIVVGGLGPASCAIAGWDAFCLAYLGLNLPAMAGRGPADIRARAAALDQGQAVILLIIVAAAAMSLAAIGVELSRAKPAHGLEKGLRVAAAFVSLTASWLTIQLVFAQHYAHAYYSADAQTGADSGGLRFPGRQAPDYWDFVHFSVIVGVAAQTADIAITSKRMRRLGTAHSLIAFTFNTLILALTINLLAGLF